jgi:copper homeostasis protein
MKHLLEVIAFDIESCLLAEASGANRIELCDNPSEGGTTPSFGLIQQARKNTFIELYPIIRPRGGDFLYSPQTFEIMKADVLACKQLGCDGVVLGLLQADGSIDQSSTSELVALAYPMGVTFHRAFDRTPDPFEALEAVIQTGCERILTSGLQPTALEGLQLISELVEKAAERIIIMPGSGIRSDNIAQIVAVTKATEFHSSARMQLQSPMQYSNPNMKEKLHHTSIDAAEVQKLVQVLQQVK